MTEKILLSHIRRHNTKENADKLFYERVDQGSNTHLRPGSTLVAAMGNHWQEGSLEAVMKMCEFAYEMGYDYCFYEEQDACYRPYDAMGTMRNEAYMKAIREGWENILYIDNDVLPPEDALAKLLKHPIPIVSPIIVYSDGLDHGLTMPKMEHNVGLVMVTSCVLSFLLIKTVVFLPWALGGFWDNALGSDEGYHFAQFYQAGHRPFVDTDVVVTCVSPPHYPLDEIDYKDLEEVKY